MSKPDKTKKVRVKLTRPASLEFTGHGEFYAKHVLNGESDSAIVGADVPTTDGKYAYVFVIETTAIVDDATTFVAGYGERGIPKAWLSARQSEDSTLNLWVDGELRKVGIEDLQRMISQGDQESSPPTELAPPLPEPTANETDNSTDPAVSEAA